MEPPLKKQQMGNEDDKDKGKSVVCIDEFYPDSSDNGNGVVPWEGQPIDHALQLANSSHICAGIPHTKAN